MMEEKMPLVFDSSGRSNKDIFQEMAEEFRNPAYRDNVNTIRISGELADQLADFFEDMANSIEEVQNENPNNS